MRNADEILDFLNTQLGEDSLAWKGEHASIKFEDGLIVDFIKIDMQTIEIVHIIEKYTEVVDATTCSSLLIANYQGGMTGPARLSLTPDFKTLALCCRLDVRATETVLFEELMMDFLKFAQFWNSEDAAGFLAGEMPEEGQPASQYATDSFVTRA